VPPTPPADVPGNNLPPVKQAAITAGLIAKAVAVVKVVKVVKSGPHVRRHHHP